MRRYHVHFTEKNLTGNAGLVHLGQFAKNLTSTECSNRASLLSEAAQPSSR